MALNSPFIFRYNNSIQILSKYVKLVFPNLFIIYNRKMTFRYHQFFVKFFMGMQKSIIECINIDETY